MLMIGGALMAGRMAEAQSAAPAASAAEAVSQTAEVSGAGSTTSEVDFGVRVVGGLGEVGRFGSFTDPRNGPTMDRLRYRHSELGWTFGFEVDRAGYRDQRYAASFEQYGKVTASFEWDQTPLWYSGVSASPFREAASGVFRLDDATQAAVQGGAPLGSYGGAVSVFDTRVRRDVARAALVYSATPALDLSASFRSTARSGAMPWSASFGFNNAIELPVTVDHRTNDVSAAAEWSNRMGMARVGYDGSFFSNGIDTLVWDNPLRLTDRTHSSAYVGGDGSSQGRMPLWPGSSSHTVSASGSLTLPARSRATAYVSVGTWLQDQSLVPHTMNTAIDPIPLARDTAEAEARIVSMLYRVTSRPTPMLWLSGQFRTYDYDNRTPHFAVDQYVRLDGVASTSATGGSEPFDLTRHFLDLDASLTPFRYVAFRAGYGRQSDSRTFRFFEETVEHTVRASVDSTGLSWGAIRLQYDHAVRTGDGLDEQVLSDIGEQVSLRQFDISDRTRDRVSAIVQVMPSESVGLSASLAVGQDRRPEASFGLQDNDLLALTFGVDIVPSDAVDVALVYGFENLSTLQRSRQASPGPQFDDPTRDWATDMNEDVHTWTADVSLPRVTTRTAVRFMYDFVRSQTQYQYRLPTNTTLGTPDQLPEVRNDFHRATADLEYALSNQVALGVGYRLDKWVVHDFGFSAGALVTPLLPAFVNTQYLFAPYDVNTGYVRVRYRW
jgi:MtrB/PioB family decaheme-associated outer membrane protein